MRPLFGWLGRGGAAARLTVLMFHRVTQQPDPLFPGEVDRARFDAICGWLARWFVVLPLEEALRRAREQTLPPGALAITFDDGYADNHDVALPVLRRHGLSATFFVATGFLDGGRMWNDTLIEAVRGARVDELDLGDGALPGLSGRLGLADLESRRAALPRLLLAAKYLPPGERLETVERIARALRAELPTALMMTSEQVRALHRSGMGIGAHTQTHPILCKLEETAAAHEIAGSRSALEQLTDAPVTLFAYPNGKPSSDYAARDVDLVRRLGFEAAFSTSPGTVTSASPWHELPRFTPWRRTRLGFGAQLAHNLLAGR